jgi:hypothetical protein
MTTNKARKYLNRGHKLPPELRPATAPSAQKPQFFLAILFATLSSYAHCQSEELIQRNLSINWRLEVIGAQLGNMQCGARQITYKGRSDNGAAMFWLNIECRGNKGGGSSGGFEAVCGVTNQQVIRSSMYTAICHPG